MCVYMPDRNHHFFINTALVQLVIQCTCLNVRCAKEKPVYDAVKVFCLNGNVNQVADMHCASINLSRIFQLQLGFQTTKHV